MHASCYSTFTTAVCFLSGSLNHGKGRGSSRHKLDPHCRRNMFWDHNFCRLSSVVGMSYAVDSLISSTSVKHSSFLPTDLPTRINLQVHEVRVLIECSEVSRMIHYLSVGLGKLLISEHMDNGRTYVLD